MSSSTRFFPRNCTHAREGPPSGAASAMGSSPGRAAAQGRGGRPRFSVEASRGRASCRAVEAGHALSGEIPRQGDASDGGRGGEVRRGEAVRGSCDGRGGDGDVAPVRGDAMEVAGRCAGGSAWTRTRGPVAGVTGKNVRCSRKEKKGRGSGE